MAQRKFDPNVIKIPSLCIWQNASRIDVEVINATYQETAKQFITIACKEGKNNTYIRGKLADICGIFFSLAFCGTRVFEKDVDNCKDPLILSALETTAALHKLQLSAGTFPKARER